MAEIHQNSAPPVFMGEFCHAIDGKNRITIPSDWRFQEEVELFLIPSLSSQCLIVMPRQELDRIRAKAAAMAGPQRMAFLRHLGSQGRQVRVDKHGRLSLPDEFCQQFKLTGDVTLCGALETIEIWNTEVWKAAVPATQAAATPALTELGL